MNHFQLAQLLILFSWKLVEIAPYKVGPCEKERTNYLARYQDQVKRYIDADAVHPIMRRDEDQIEAEDLSVVRKELHAAASSLVLFVFFSAFEPDKVPLHVGLNHFLAAYGTNLSHVFTVGSGKFPHIESFFYNLERVYVSMWMKRPIPANLELDLGKVLMPGANLTKTKAASKCNICKKAVGRGVTLYPLAYTLSRNDACYPRKIFLSDLDEDEYDQIYDVEELHMTAEGMACSPLCMVQYLRSIILEVNLLIRNAGLPKFFLKEMDSPPFREFSKKVLKLLKHSNLHLFIRAALIPSSERIVLRRVPLHEMEWGICSPDYTDPRFRSNVKKFSRMETLPIALQVANPWSVGKIFGLDGTPNSRAVDFLCRMRSRNPEGTSLLGMYRKRLSKMVIHGGQGNVSEEFTVRFIWRGTWGLVNDITCDLPADQMIKLSFKRIKPMDAVQPPDSVYDSVRKKLKRGEESTAADLVFPIRHSFVSLSHYVSGAKFRVGAESKAAKRLLARVGMEADCLLFARDLDLRNKTCFGGFIVQEASCYIAIVVDDMYDLLMSEVSEFLLRKTFLKFHAAKWNLSETKYRPLKDEGPLFIPRADATRWAVTFYLDLVLCLRSVTQGDPDYKPGNLKMLQNSPDYTIRLSLKNWRGGATSLEKRVVLLSPKSAKSRVSAFLGDIGLNSTHFKTETVESKRLLKVTPWRKGEFPSVATDDARCEYVGKYWCQLTVTIDLAGKHKVCNLIAPRNRPVRELLRARYGKRFDDAMVIRIQHEDLECRVRTVNLANDVTPLEVMRQYGVCVDHLKLILTDDAAATAKSMNSHESIGPLSPMAATYFGRTEFGDNHFIYSSHRILWAGMTGLGEELQIPMILTECSQNEERLLKPEDWKLWLKISKKLGRYLPYDLVFEGNNDFHRYIKKIAESKDTFQLCIFLGSQQDPDRCEHDDESGPGACRDLLAREMTVLSVPNQMAYIVIPFDERTGVTAVMVLGNKGHGDKGCDCRFMRLIVPRKIRPLKLKGGSELSPRERIKLLRSKPALTSEQAQGISEEYLVGYVTAIVGKQPISFAVSSSSPITDDLGTLFQHQYEKFGEGNESMKLVFNGLEMNGEMRVGGKPFTKLDSNRRGYHVLLVVERSLVRNAVREPLQSKYLVNHYSDCESEMDEKTIVRHKIGYDLTAVIVCGPMEDVRDALLKSNADYFASGMLVLTEGSNLYLLPKDKRLRIAESLCSLESGALWKQVDLGHSVGPPFKGQDGVLKSACRPWESRNGGEEGNELDESLDGPESQAGREEEDPTDGNNQTTDGAGASEGAGIEETEEKSEKQKLKERRIAEAKKLLEVRERLNKAKKRSPEEEMAKFREAVNRLIKGMAVNEEDDSLYTCGYCSKIDFDLGFCSRCREVRYCDNECFQKDRKKHYGLCKGRDGKGQGQTAFDQALEKCIQLTEDVVIPNFDAIRSDPR